MDRPDRRAPLTPRAPATPEGHREGGAPTRAEAATPARGEPRRERGWPWLSFRYSYRGIVSDGERAHVVVRERRFEDGRLEAEDLEGTLEGAAAAQLFEEARRVATDALEDASRAALGAARSAGELVQSALELQRRLLLAPFTAWLGRGQRER